MTAGDGIVVLVCLAAGYWLVSRILGAPEAQPGAEPAKDTDTAGQPAAPAYEAVTPANWFQVLEVSEAASREEITAAYRRKVSQYHPDKVSQMGADIRAVADAKTQQVNAAYEMGMRLTQ